MQYYKIEGFIHDAKWVSRNNDRDIEQQNARRIASKSYGFNQKLGSKGFLCVSSIVDSKVTACAIETETDVIDNDVTAFLKAVSLELHDVVCEEVTFNTVGRLLSNACRNDFIVDDDEIMELFGLDPLKGRWGHAIGFGENMIPLGEQKQILASCERYLAKDTLVPEVNRIYAQRNTKKLPGHPVHYIFETDNLDIRKEMYRLLLQALYAAGRLQNRRYSFIDIENESEFSRVAYDALYKSSSGGAIVIRYTGSNREENEYASTDRKLIEAICGPVNQYRNSVLTVLCLPRECKRLKDIFYEYLGNTCFIEITEDLAYGDEARSYLRMLCSDNHVRADKKLLERVGEGTGYLSTELREMWDNWYDVKLRSDIYPQYKTAQTVKKELQKQSPKGSAYDRLTEMIGLDSAKSVINQALCYYKAQKLYAEKGMRADRPAMHMVFTGNPGTAKTTVARLFAEIMKENGLLSRGHLVECGRGDLVGQYVGWTAPTIKKKFKQAKGGVLFIDEAYSLVDDRDGSFGDEAINTIVQEMENARDDTVVIFAGYPDKMEHFLEKNPGLRSRIAFHVSFDDYSTEELCGIARLIAKSKGLVLEDAAVEKMSGIFDTARQQTDFGNGRYVRNVIEKARMAQSARLVAIDFDDVTKEDVITIKAEDVELPRIDPMPTVRRIGFCA